MAAWSSLYNLMVAQQEQRPFSWATVRRILTFARPHRVMLAWFMVTSVLLAVLAVATPLLAVLVLVEVTDIVFAVDSIPAIFAVTSEPFLVFTANAFAILGLRAMYFLLADLIHRFVYLKAGLSLVLIWVGTKMLLLDVVYIPTTVSLAVVATIITTSIVASLRVTRGQGRREVEAATAGAFRVATAEELASVESLLRRAYGSESGRRPRRH